MTITRSRPGSLARRRRRREQEGFLYGYRNQLSPPTATVDEDSFPNKARDFALQVRVRVTGAANGMIFELGDATTALALYMSGTTVVMRAGNTGDDAAIATSGVIGVNRELQLIGVVRPGLGVVRIYDGSTELARATAVNGAFPAGWAAASDGAFAAAATGALPGDVSQTGAPSGFQVISALRVFDRVPGFFST